MTKVAALYIATGRYTVFWPEFYESAEKYLLKDCEVHYFVFTDAATLPGDDNPRVHICAQEAYSWPFATLRRFEIFLKQEQALKAFDYIFFFNANAEFMQPVTREMLLPRAEKGEHLLVVQHPSFYAKPNYESPMTATPAARPVSLRAGQILRLRRRQRRRGSGIFAALPHAGCTHPPRPAAQRHCALAR